MLLDEPTSALDPAGRRAIRTLLLELRGRGIAVLLNSHLLGEVERVCDRVVILARGRSRPTDGQHELTHAGGVEIQTGNGPRTFPRSAPRRRPANRRRLVAEGVDIYEVTIIRSTLEDAYLEVVDPG